MPDEKADKDLMRQNLGNNTQLKCQNNLTDSDHGAAESRQQSPDVPTRSSRVRNGELQIQLSAPILAISNGKGNGKGKGNGNGQRP